MKHFLSLVFVLLTLNSLAQNWVKFFDAPQQSSNVKLRLFCHQGYSKSLDGQFFNYKIKNTSTNRLEISFDMVAITICGTKVTCPVSMTLNPQETDGGKVGQMWQITYPTQNVTNADCSQTNPAWYTDKGVIHKVVNKIENVTCANYKEKIIPNEKPIKSSGKAQKAQNEMTEDEKLNNALMNKMEKDFDKEKNAKKQKENGTNLNSENKTLSKKTEEKYLPSKNSEKLSTKYFLKKGIEFSVEKDSTVYFNNTLVKAKLSKDFTFNLYNSNIEITAKANTWINFFTNSYLVGYPSHLILKNSTKLPLINTEEKGFDHMKNEECYNKSANIDLPFNTEVNIGLIYQNKSSNNNGVIKIEPVFSDKVGVNCAVANNAFLINGKLIKKGNVITKSSCGEIANGKIVVHDDSNSTNFFLID